MAGYDASGLKRLGFVQAYALQALTLAESVYKTARGYVPGAAEPLVGWVEDTATTYGSPYYTWAQDTADWALRTADSTADAALDTAFGVHAKGMDSYTSAKEGAYAYLTTTANKAWTTVENHPTVVKALDYGSAAKDGLVYWADPDKLVDTTVETYYKAKTWPIVSIYLSIVEPIVSYAAGFYPPLHKYVVSQPLYKTAWEITTGTIDNTYQTVVKAVPELPLVGPVVKQAIDLGYPYAAPVVDPIATNFTTSKYLKQAYNHMLPTY